MRTTLPCTFGFVLCFISAVQAQQIPNGGFEVWSNSGGYQDPDGWLTSNVVSWSLANTLTCEQGSPGVVGTHFVKVSDRELPGAGMQQGSITVGVQGSFPAFPFTGRPDALNGYWQYHPLNGGSDGVVNAALTRWNPVTHQREYIANAPIHAMSAIPAWQAFSSPFLYYSDQEPDSAIVSIAATNASAGDGTSIWVDELSFGLVQAVVETSAAVLFTLTPSPASDQLRITASIPMAEFTIRDMSGRTMQREFVTTVFAAVDVSALPVGMYVADVRLVDGRRSVQRFAKE